MRSYALVHQRVPGSPVSGHEVGLASTCGATWSRSALDHGRARPKSKRRSLAARTIPQSCRPSPLNPELRRASVPSYSTQRWHDGGGQRLGRAGDRERRDEACSPPKRGYAQTTHDRHRPCVGPAAVIAVLLVPHNNTAAGWPCSSTGLGVEVHCGVAPGPRLPAVQVIGVVRSTPCNLAMSPIDFNEIQRIAPIRQANSTSS